AAAREEAGRPSGAHRPHTTRHVPHRAQRRAARPRHRPGAGARLAIGVRASSGRRRGSRRAVTKVRSLVGIDYDVMTAAFNDAFSDYDIPAHYTVEYLRGLVLRRGYRPDLAVGAFDGGRLVGFVFNCLDGDEAYNSGTGVV